MDVENERDEWEQRKAKRLSEYKCKSTTSDQESRRCELLRNQKRRRDDQLNEFRNITGLLSDSETEEDMAEEECQPEEEFMEWTNTKPKLPRLKDMLMFSEWMVNLPENLEDKWLFVLCPIGKRCLGFTTVYGRGGRRLAKFQSGLPNGGQRDHEKLKYSNSEVTILDCIWNAWLKCYYVLDLLSWKGQFYMDTETSFRVFWIRSKLQEMPWLSERSEENPFPFLPLEYHPSDRHTLSSVLTREIRDGGPKIDGILFYHGEAFYTPGSTPLVVWLKPFMVPEILNVAVAEFYLLARPTNYVDMSRYIEEYEERSAKKRERFERRRRRRKNGGCEEVDMAEEVT